MWKYCCIFRIVRVKRGIGEQVWFVLNIFGGSESWSHPRTYPSTQSDTKLLYKYKHIFFLKTGNLILNWAPSLSPTIIPFIKDYPHNLEVQPKLLFEKKVPSFFLNLEKLRSPARASFSKISLRIEKNLELKPKINT